MNGIGFDPRLANVGIGKAHIKTLKADSLEGNIVPITSGSNDLGSPSSQFRDAYFSGVVQASNVVVTHDSEFEAALKVTQTSETQQAPIADFYDDDSLVLRIAQGGNVGIGVTDPTERLYIDGNIVITGTLHASNVEVTGESIALVTGTYETIIIDNFGTGIPLTVTQHGAGPIADFYSDESIIMRISDTGKIGIGTGAPNAVLDIYNTSNVPSFQINSNQFVILNTGNVGIGVTNPNVALQVQGTVHATVFSGNGASLTALNANNVSNGTLAVERGGTGNSSYAIGDLLYASGTTTLSKLADVDTGSALISGGSNVAPSWGKVGLTTHVSGTLGATNGGTGTASYAVGDLLYASDTTTLSKLADVATGSALISGGSNAAPSWGKVGLTTHVSGTLGVANGGTGTAFYSVGDLLYASDTTTLSKLADVATGSALISGGSNAAPSWGKVGLTTHVSGTLGVANGGTGTASYSVGDLLYASSTTALSKLADVATGSALISGGVNTAPSWGKVGLTTHVTGTLGVAYGGTGSNTLAANKLLVGNGTSPVLQPSTLHWDDTTGRLGIGSSAPQQLLDVNGNLRVGGQVVSAAAQGTAPFVVGSTTLVTNLNSDLLNGQSGSYYLDWTNFTNRPTINNTQWTTSGTNIYYNGGNVGIGEGSPSAPLHVKATGNTSPMNNALYIYNPTNSANQHAILSVRTAGASGGNPFVSFDVAGVQGWSIGQDRADGDKFKIASSWNSLSTNTRLSIDTAGAVSIGGNLTAGSLTTGGNFTASGKLYIGNTSTNYTGAWEPNIRIDCADYAEMTIHDANTRVVSPIYYEGPNNRIYIGRDVGWGRTTVNIFNLKIGDTYGTCEIKEGNADNATYDNYNLAIRSWWGIGFPSYDNVNRIVFNTRNGNISTKGSLTVGSDGNTFGSGNDNAYIQLFLQRPGNTAYGWYIGQQTASPDSSDNDLYFGVRRNNAITTPGYIQDNVAMTQMNFTGQHKCFIKDMSSDEISQYIGLIVSANQNKYIRMSNGNAIGKEAITITESLPIVTITTASNDKSVMGVISDVEDPEKRREEYGIFVTLFQKEKGDTRAYINSLGEGAIWVSDVNGSLESGDYITSSSIPGYGMKQNDDVLHNYTVAKITMDCDFNPAYIPKCKIKKDPITQENVLDEKGNLIWEEVKDEGDNTIYEKEYDMRYLSLDGTQITEAEYLESLSSNLPVSRAAFVGCTYHCG